MTDFYTQVERYYDGDATGFDSRYWKNPVLQRMRQDFREEAKRYPFTRMLEIGYGSGLDLVHFGKTHPGVQVSGIDISGGMQALASEKIRFSGLANVRAKKGSVEDLSRLYPGQYFDMVVVFFGALNTVEDLRKAADHIFHVTRPGGMLVLSFVNRHYVAGILIELLKFRFRAAFSRYRKSWGGYSPSQNLPSRCYGPRYIKQAFSAFHLHKKKGYSIVHPAWYYHRINQILQRFSRCLWKADVLLNKTVCWSWGEYTLFVFQKPDNISQQ